MRFIAAAAPRRVPAGRGWNWLVEAFDLFRRAPATWIGIVAVYLLILFGTSLIPGASLLMFLAGPAFVGGMMLGCDSQAAGRELRIGHLFEAFSGGRLGQLLVLALIYGAASLGLMLAMALVALFALGISPAHFSGGTIPDEYLLPLVLLVLLMLALYVPLAMGMWLAPALIVLQGQAALDAFKGSFRACLDNFAPFLIYGLAALALGVAATIPLAIGWLLLAPVLFISMYTAYRDIFPPAAAPPPL